MLTAKMNLKKCNCPLCHYITGLAYRLSWSLCFYTESRELTSLAEGACRPQGLQWLMEVEV